jgi:hypothetical protein
MTLREQIIALREHGATYDQIQAQLKCSKGTIAYYLGEGQKEKTHKRQNDQRAKVARFIAGVKDNQHCVECGIAYRYWQLEFDHLSEKEFTIGQFRSHTTDLARIKAEIEKCEIVCANCHRDRTYRRRVESEEN